MAYSRAQKLAGQPALVVGTTGGAVNAIKNWGVTIISATSSEVYTLTPPEAGVEKTIVFQSSSTGIAPLIRGSTGQTVTFSGGALGANTALPTMFKPAVTRSTNMNVVVSLVGLSSTEWAVKSVYPVIMLTTLTGNGVGSVVFSTT
jgi:hypothetical protein